MLDAEGKVFIHPDPAVAAPLTSLRGREDVEAVLAGQTSSRTVVGLNGVETLVS